PACGAPPRSLVALPPPAVARGAEPAFAAEGRARFVAADGGEVDGRLRVRVEPPRRAWAEVQSDALAGLVRSRVVASLPGDGYLVTWDERSDRIERVRFDESWAAALVPGSSQEALLAIALGALPEATAPSRSDGRYYP